MKDKKMNFIFFFPDEMSAEILSCYGNEKIKTPNFEQLANEGVLFEKCYVQNPICSPSRCSLVTGLYPHNAGHRTLGHLVRPHEPSLFRYLNNNGYKIGWYGKNDVYSKDYLKELFDNSDNIKFYERGKYGGNNTLYFGEDKANCFLYDESDEGGVRTSRVHVEKGLEFLESVKDNDQPFILFLPIILPHPAYFAPPGYHKMYDDIDVRLKPIIEENKPLYHKLIRQYRKLELLSEEELKSVKRVYMGMTSYVDHLLGLVMDRVKELGLDETTTIIASSDHGDWPGDYGLVEKWPNAMDDSITKVPLIIKSPDCKQGTRVDGPVELFDIMPTILELANIKLEHKHFAKSLVQQLYGTPGDKNRAVFCEGGYSQVDIDWFEGENKKTDLSKADPKNSYYPKQKQQLDFPDSVCRTVMIRKNNFKLVKRIKDVCELYDMTKDPQELINLYFVDEYKSVVHELEQEILNWYLNTSDTVPFDQDERGS